jgi:hypothetical protein
LDRSPSISTDQAPPASNPIERDLQVRMIAALQLAPQDRELVQAVGAEMLAQTTRHFRLLHWSKLERDPQELVQRAPELARPQHVVTRHRQNPNGALLR